MLFDADYLKHIYSIVKPDSTWLHCATINHIPMCMVYMENFTTHHKGVVLAIKCPEDIIDSALEESESIEFSNKNKPPKSKSVFNGCAKFLKTFFHTGRPAMEYSYLIDETDGLRMICNGYCALITKEVPDHFHTDYEKYGGKDGNGYKEFAQRALNLMDNVGSEIELAVPKLSNIEIIDDRYVFIDKRKFAKDLLIPVFKIINPQRIIAENESIYSPIHLYNNDGREAIVLPVRY